MQLGAPRETARGICDGQRSRHGSRTAVITARNRVRVDLKKFEEGMIDAVLAAGIMPRGQGRVGLERAVGTACMHGPKHARHDAAITIYATAHRDDGGMSRITRRQLFSVSHYDSYRPS